MIRQFLTITFTAMLIITPVQVALANCALRDLGGEWQFYNTWSNDFDGFNWSRCTFVLDKNGSFLSAFDCEDSDDIGMIDDPMIEGQLTVSRDCVVTGSVILDDDVEMVQAEIVHATMNGRKDMIVGVGSDEPNSFWTFNMIER